MELNHLLLEAISLMFVGMLSVGTFLGTLVLLIPLLNKITPEDEPIAQPRRTNASNATLEQGELVAVISAAVQQYRKKH